MENCIFCKIINRQIPSEIVYEDDRMLAFKDVNPIAPVHILMIPKEHIASATEINESTADIVAHIFNKAKEIAALAGVKDKGFRIVNNCGEDGGQTVMHLHFHLLGGKTLPWE